MLGVGFVKSIPILRIHWLTWLRLTATFRQSFRGDLADCTFPLLVIIDSHDKIRVDRNRLNDAPRAQKLITVSKILY